MSIESITSDIKTCSTNLENSLENIKSVNKSLAILATQDLSITKINDLLQSLGDKIISNIRVRGVDNVMDVVYKSTSLTLTTDKTMLNAKEFLLTYDTSLNHNLKDDADPLNTNNFLIFFIGLDNKVVTYKRFTPTNEALKTHSSTILVEKAADFVLDDVVHENVNYIEVLGSGSDSDNKYKLVIVHEKALRV